MRERMIGSWGIARRAVESEAEGQCNDGSMQVQPLIIVGASARAAAFSARGAGFDPFCIDLFADADLKACCPVIRIAFQSYPNGFSKLIREAPSGPWIYTGGLENHPDLIEHLTTERPLWGNDANVLREVRDPPRLFRAFREAGLPSPECRAQVPEAGSAGRWLEKPLAGAGGNGIRIWQPGAGRQNRRTYFQQFIAGESAAATFVGFKQQAILLGVTRQLVGESWLNAKPFHYCGSIGPLPLRETLRRRFERIGDILVRQFHLRGLFGVDAVIHDDWPFPVEVNPRYTASMEVLEFATGVQVIDWHRRAFENSENPFVLRARADEDFVSKHRRIVGKAILFAAREFKFQGTKPDRLASSGSTPPNPPRGGGGWGGSSRSMPAFADIPEAGTVIESGWPVLTCFAEGASMDEVADQLRKITSSVCK